MIVVIDYGMGNCNSIVNMFKKVGADACVSSDPQVLAAAKGIVLPGVGAFDNGMKKLRETGLLACIEEAVLYRKVPFLGICLGMHLLFEASEEGSEPGLGWLRGKVVRFKFPAGKLSSLKIPHMGWNEMTVISEVPPFSIAADENRRYYFVHSYHVACADDSDVLATSEYGYEFASAVARENIIGFQFHPEKSHRYGFQLFKQFNEFVKNHA